MRRLTCVLILCLVSLLPFMALAQEATPDPTVVSLAEDAAARAEFFMNEAKRYAEDSSNYLGIFESVGVAIGVLTGVVIPALAVVAGFFGWNRLNSARNELTEARQRMEREVEALRAAVQEELRVKQGELDALKDEIRMRADDERVKSEQATLALSLLPLGDRQYSVDDYDGALNTFQRALALDPDNIVIHYRIGYVFTQMGNLEQATAHLTRALEIEPNFAPALANLGYVLRRKAERLPPDDVKRGELFAQAEQKMRQALTISPKLVDEDGESWWGSLGGLHRRRGQLDDAILAYERALEVTPQASYPLINLALLYLQKGDIERMLQACVQAERIAARRTLVDMTDFWAWADLLVAQLVQRKFAEARETLDSLLGAIPTAATDLVNTPLGTLRQLAHTFEGEDSARLAPFIERLEAHVGQGQAVSVQS